MTEHSEAGNSHHEHNHSRKYYENQNKYVYTEEEIQAYRVPIKFNNKCVNLFIPYRECVRTISPLRALLDPKKGKCSQEVEDYEHCMKFYSQHEHTTHVNNTFYANPAQAKIDVVSPTLEQSFYKSLLSFSW